MAFVRGILAEPADRLRRLVFADWLDERGGESNTAWASYIRTQAEWETTTDSERRNELIGLMKEYRPSIRARLTLHVRAVQDRFLHLLRLLPSGNVTIRLNDAEILRAILELMPESVAREHLVLPIGLRGTHLPLVTPTPRDQNLSEKLNFILNKDVVMFHAGSDEVSDAIRRHYGEYETESIDCVHYESPLIGLEGGSLHLLFHSTFERGFNGFTLQHLRDTLWVEFFDHTGRRVSAVISPDVYGHLLAHLHSLEVESERVQEGVFERQVNLPLLSGRPCPIRFERQVDGEGWYRVTFLWG